MLRTFLKAFGLAFLMPPSFKLIEPTEAFAQQDNGGLLLIDVRNPDEWEIQGVPLGAEQVALTDPSFVSRVHALVVEHPEKKVAITCLSGKRSENAIELLQRNGFTNLLSVRRGLHGWLEAGLPLKRS